jgi:hypothetical protein
MSEYTGEEILKLIEENGGPEGLASQAIIGISLAGLLGFVAGNRIRRS